MYGWRTNKSNKKKKPQKHYLCGSTRTLYMCTATYTCGVLATDRLLGTAVSSLFALISTAWLGQFEKFL